MTNPDKIGKIDEYYTTKSKFNRIPTNACTLPEWHQRAKWASYVMFFMFDLERCLQLQITTSIWNSKNGSSIGKTVGKKTWQKLLPLWRFVRSGTICATFKKREIHPWSSVTFSRVSGFNLKLYLTYHCQGVFSRLLYCTNGNKSRKASYIFFSVLLFNRMHNIDIIILSKI